MSAKFFDGTGGNPMLYIGTSCLNQESIEQHVQNLWDLGLTKQTHNGIICATGFLTTDEVLKPDYAAKKDTLTVTAKELEGILQQYGEELFTILHHFRKSGEGSFYEDIDSLFTRISPYLPDGIQINNPISREQLERLKERYPEPCKRLILQVREKAWQMNVLEYLSEHADTASAVIIDPSAGTGLDIDIEYAAETMIRINEKFPGLHMSVAGGFGPDSVAQRVESIFKELKSRGKSDLVFSVDAQDKIRTRDESRPKRGYFDNQKSLAYLSSALAAFQQQIKS